MAKVRPANAVIASSSHIWALGRVSADRIFLNTANTESNTDSIAISNWLESLAEARVIGRVDAYAFAMTRSELIERLAGHHGVDPGEAKIVVQEILDAMTGAVSDGRRIEIRGFGSFALSRIPPRAGRNPKTGESVIVPGKARPRFKAGKELRERLVSQG